jgi:hypothetical protein
MSRKKILSCTRRPTLPERKTAIPQCLPAAKMDPGATPRLKSILKCLYATLSVSIPMYALQITGLIEPFGSFWTSPIALMFTLIFSSTVVIVTFRDRARMHPDSTKPPPALPAPCRLPTIIICFFIVLVWIGALGVLAFISYLFTTVIAIVEIIFILAQIGLLLAVGILGSLERRDMKRAIRKGQVGGIV